MPSGMRSKFNVTVLFVITGRTVEMPCRRSDSVEKFKQKLSEETKMRWFGQRLFYEDKELQNDQTIGTYGIKRNAQLKLLFDDNLPQLVESFKLLFDDNLPT